MHLTRARIRNFRSIRDITVDFKKQTAIVGGNGCGKSTILRAVDKFYGTSTNLDPDDFFGRDTNSPVDIELTYEGFNDVERQLFDSRIIDGQMTVARVFDYGGRNTGKFYGSTLRHEGFAEIRRTAQATPKREAYDTLRAEGGIYVDLPRVGRADQIDPALAAWEAGHPDELTLGRDDGQFFGFTNVGKGALQKATSFVFVPAVRDASADSVDAKGAVIARLMELVVRSAISQREEIRAWQIETARQYRELVDPDRLPELGDLATGLSVTLQLFYADAGVGLSWKPGEEFSVPLPSADVTLDDDGFAGPVEKKGHGLQRAFILSLLQHLSVASTKSALKTAIEDEDIDEPDEEQALAIAAALQNPSLILAIEEPELYQHPTKQRHFAKVLSALSSGRLPGAAGNTQVLYASHSSLFVGMDRFEEVRLARRRPAAGTDFKECVIGSSNLTEVARALEFAHAAPPGSFTDEGLLARLHILGPELAEGFFADCVVLVEGASDCAAIGTAAKLLGIDFEAEGVAVLAVDGKTNLDRPAAIFQALGIPTYVVWDCDRDEADKVPNLTQALPRLLGSNPLPAAATVVTDRFACFQDKLETTIRAELGEQTFATCLQEARLAAGIPSGRDPMKTPFVVSRLIAGAHARGAVSDTLQGIARSVIALRRGPA